MPEPKPKEARIYTYVRLQYDKVTLEGGDTLWTAVRDAIASMADICGGEKPDGAAAVRLYYDIYKQVYDTLRKASSDGIPAPYAVVVSTISREGQELKHATAVYIHSGNVLEALSFKNQLIDTREREIERLKGEVERLNRRLSEAQQNYSDLWNKLVSAAAKNDVVLQALKDALPGLEEEALRAREEAEDEEDDEAYLERLRMDEEAEEEEA